MIGLKQREGDTMPAIPQRGETFFLVQLADEQPNWKRLDEAQSAGVKPEDELLAVGFFAITADSEPSYEPMPVVLAINANLPPEKQKLVATSFPDADKIVFSEGLTIGTLATGYISSVLAE